jgi:3-phenylpropionate/trans-cinnamate dioxygenase ferredoxin subunit
LVSFRVARVGGLPPGKMIGAELDGQKILVANIGGEFYAMGSECNHMGGQLDKGKLEGNVVTCPRHGSRWDVKTGKLVQFSQPLEDEPIFKVSVKGDEIFVEKRT